MQLTYISFGTVIVETVSTKHGFVEVRSSIMSKPLIGAAGEQDKIKQSITKESRKARYYVVKRAPREWY